MSRALISLWVLFVLQSPVFWWFCFVGCIGLQYCELNQAVLLGVANQKGRQDMRSVQFYKLLKVQIKGQEYCNVVSCIGCVISQKKLSCNGVHAVSVSDKGMEFSGAKNFAFILQKKELENHSLQLVWFWERGEGN